MTLHRALAAIALLTALRLLWLTLNVPELYADEAQYWVWAQSPSLGYFTKPPLIAWLIGASTAACGDGEGCVRVWVPLLHAGTALLILRAGTLLFGERTGCWAGLIYATLPAVFVSSTIASTDVPLLFFWALALLAVLRIREGAGVRWWLALGLAIGLGMLAKYAMAAFIGSFVLLIIADCKMRARLRGAGPFVALAAALIVMGPNLAWNMTHDFASLRHVGANANLGGGPRFNIGKGFEFIGAQFGVFGPVLFALLLVLFARGRALWADARFRLLLIFTVPLLAVIAAQGFLSRANPNWAAAAYVAATLLVAGWCVTQGQERWLRASLGLHVAVALLIFLGPVLAEAVGHPLPRRFDPWMRQRGQAALGGAVAALLRENPGARLLADQRRDMATLVYYVRPHPFDAAMWDVDDVPNNEFELTARLPADERRPLIWVTRREDIAEVASRFEHVTPLARITVPTHPDAALRFRAFRLEGFRGY